MNAALDAYARARRVQPGCQHNLGCEAPYWLRDSTPVEQAREVLRRLTPAQWDFMATALRVVERRRDELKAQVEALTPAEPAT